MSATDARNGLNVMARSDGLEKLMTERDIDPTRQGGTVVAVQPPQAAPEMSLSEALEYHAKFEWRSIPTKSDRAREALIAEIRRLLFEAESGRELALRQATAWAQGYREISAEVERLREANSNLVQEALSFESEARDALSEVERFRAALSDIIGCPYGDPAPCRFDEHGFYPCCRAHRAAVRHGLLPAIERMVEAEDGA